ncbi:hypothetical protein Tco_0597976, partial [Tanacetum coccineum]
LKLMWKTKNGSWLSEKVVVITSSYSAFDQPSFIFHLNDDDDDGNDEGTSRASTPSLIRYVNSLTNQVPQVFQNPPNIDPHLEPFYTRQSQNLKLCQVNYKMSIVVWSKVKEKS